MRRLSGALARPGTSALLVLSALAMSGAIQAQSPSPEVLLEDALYQELALADSAAALEGYAAILRLPAPPPRVAAQAHLRLALAHHWKGDEAEARKHFQAVTGEFSGESDLARVARHYLGQPVLDDPAVFMPENMLFYGELVEPRENIRGLSAILAGTPFQNPVDYYVSSLARIEPRSGASPAEAEPARKAVPNEAAYLNEGFLREIQLVEALAIGVPGDGNPEEDFLAVLDPGDSNIIRGLVQMGLTISRSEPVGTVSDTPVFRLPPTDEISKTSAENRLHIALGRNSILLGRPLRLVEESIERGAGRRASLADSADFQRARAARQGGIFFSYLGRDRILAAVRSTAKPADLPVFDAIVGALGLSRFDSIGLTLARLSDQDSLRLEARSLVTRRDFPLWKALAAPALSTELLRLVPPRTLGYFATRLDHAVDRIDAAFEAFQPLVELAQKAGDPAPAERVAQVRELLAGESARTFLGALDGVAFGLGVGPHENGIPPLFVTLELHGSENAGPLLEGLVTALFQRFLQNPASRSFQPETLESGGKSLEVRCLEPLPGLRLRHRSHGRLTILSPSSELLFAAEEAYSAGRSAEPSESLRGSGKLLYLNPRAILEHNAEGTKLPSLIRLALGELERVVLVAREEGDVVALDVLVPGVTATSRAILNRIAEAMTRKRSR